MTDGSGSAAWTYDAEGRITAENYSIDAWGNLMISPMPGKTNGGNFQCSGENREQAETGDDGPFSDNRSEATCLLASALRRIDILTPLLQHYQP